MAGNDFQLAAKRAEAAHSPAEWLSLGQRGRSAAIYKELREIDHQAAERLARKIETARRHVREGEVRLARQEAILSKLQGCVFLCSVNGLADAEHRKSGTSPFPIATMLAADNSRCRRHALHHTMSR